LISPPAARRPPLVAATLGMHPAGHVVVPGVTGVGEAGDGGLDVLPSSPVLECSPDEFRDEADLRPGACGSVQLGDQRVIEGHTHARVRRSAHSEWWATERPMVPASFNPASRSNIASAVWESRLPARRPGDQGSVQVERGTIDAMGSDKVDAAVERITARDVGLGRDAEAAAAQLTGGEGAEVIYQAGLQDDLWWRVPKRFPPDTWHEIAHAAAALLEELDLHRYAALARSDTTTEILDSWAHDPRAGHERATAARQASGVGAPDTELLVWGQTFGAAEARALESVERALEAAIVVGELVAGGRGWKARAAEVTDRELQAPLDLPPGQTLLTMVTTERIERWITTVRDPELTRPRQEVANRLLNPVDPPDGFESVVAPMQWLLGHAADGIEMTQSGYLARAVVVEGAERFSWLPDWHKPPRSEADVFALGDLRDMATQLRLVRKKGRTLTATAAGNAALADPQGLWRRLAGNLGGRDDFGQVLAELLGLCLLEGPSAGDSLAHAVQPMLAALGWQVDGAPLGLNDVRSAVCGPLNRWRTLAVADHRSGRWDPETHQQVETASERLTDAGEATVLAYLRQRATAPMRGPYG
jgi:hypothetical protein